ncbi:hypothetical protein N781_12220 [Pontibacillus halophilus JSM 076056 = DSM 19796]|uniref:Flagellar assembly protein FliH n=1 Tax=Pontibacillus halophilus JSM 076056 = DSM 19796 TaxID=1385510 RepID=A0A0A5GMV5_9BACI|nr:flagellar assembly protein FliH [Pontibacillus halophilus]KGX93329.1 hypothetical protein N781_12220 [Pontibacillus halophilus JSM 076056 = DSM 19796]
MSNSSRSVQPKVIGIKPVLLEERAPIETERSKEELVQEAEQAKEHAQLHLQQAREEAERIKEQALADANAEREKWEQERERVVELAKDEGYQIGYERGREAAHQEYERLLDDARNIVAQSKVQHDEKVESAEETILQMSFNLASHLMKQTLDERPEAFTSIVRAAIHEVKEQESVSLYVHPNFYYSLLQHKEEFQQMLDHQLDLAIYPKEGESVYLCILETPFGRIEASLDSQLNELRDSLFSILEEVRSSEGQSTLSTY